MTISILLADDHQIMCEGLTNLLEKQSDMKVIAVADNGRIAVKLTQELRPNVVIMDVIMPSLNGIEATRQINTKYNSIKVIALSMHSDRRFVAKMLCAGASGYVLKECAFKELIQAIHTVLADKIYLSPQITQIVTKEYVNYMSNVKSISFPVLTAREREVLQLMAEGKTTKEIAGFLYVSPKTIEVHRKNMMDKLNIHSIAGLIKYAISEGLTSLET